MSAQSGGARRLISLLHSYSQVSSGATCITPFVSLYPVEAVHTFLLTPSHDITLFGIDRPYVLVQPYEDITFLLFAGQSDYGVPGRICLVYFVLAGSS